MRNTTLFITFFVLIFLTLIAASLQWYYGNNDNWGMFVVTALTAIGTCGVTILNVFPYEKKDKLEAVIYFWKNGIRLTITNKTNHTIYLGTDRYAVPQHFQDYARWWPTDKKCNPDDGGRLWAKPGDNLAVPPRSSICSPINPKVFGKNELSKLKIQVLTSSGYRFDVKNNLTKKSIAS